MYKYISDPCALDFISMYKFIRDLQNIFSLSFLLFVYFDFYLSVPVPELELNIKARSLILL